MTLRRTVGLLLSLSALTAACGGGDGDDASASTTTSATAASSTTTASTTTTVASSTTTSTSAVVPLPSEGRSTVDRPDDDPVAPRIQVLYLTPSDGPDDGLDTDGTIAGSIESSQGWLDDQIGRRLRFDTYQGELDIVFHRLPRTGDEYFAEGVFIRDAIEADLIADGFDKESTIYAGFYAGPAEDCASAFNPETLPGTTVVSYWAHVRGGEALCVPDDFRSAGDPPGTWELGTIHELFHALGAVATCAPNHFEGHVGDFPYDLMYRGDEPWVPDTIDVDRDDYYGHGDPDCTDVARSAYWAN